MPRWLIIAVLLVAGCTSQGKSDIDARNRAVQECILRGGHPHLGPDPIIIICTN